MKKSGYEKTVLFRKARVGGWMGAGKTIAQTSAHVYLTATRPAERIEWTHEWLLAHLSNGL